MAAVHILTKFGENTFIQSEDITFYKIQYGGRYHLGFSRWVNWAHFTLTVLFLALCTTFGWNISYTLESLKKLTHCSSHSADDITSCLLGHVGMSVWIVASLYQIWYKYLHPVCYNIQCGRYLPSWICWESHVTTQEGPFTVAMSCKNNFVMTGLLSLYLQMWGLYFCLPVNPFICHLWNLLKHSLGGST